jgi:predicted DNA-binding transcriptional regulator AlpA
MLDIVTRLERLEAVVFGRTATSSGALPDRRLTKREVALRFGVSTRTIDRRVRDGSLPAPETVNKHHYWWLSQLEEHDAAR